MKCISLRCVVCCIQIATELHILTDITEISMEDGEPLIEEGMYLKSSTLLDADYIWNYMTRDEIILNMKDIQNTELGGKLNGCCGIDGMDGINTFCVNGHPLGTEHSDCWMSHFVNMPLKYVYIEKCEEGK